MESAASNQHDARSRARVTVVLFDGFELLDVFGPVQLLQRVPGVVVDFAGPSRGPVASGQGVEVVAQLSHRELTDPDILLVPGGQGTRALVHDLGFLAWLADVGGRARLVASVCTGSALLAASGLLEGHRATSNKAAFGWASGFGDAVEWVATARWVHDRDRWTSSGVAAGMDMAAALIADQWGSDAARASTTRAEYEPHPDADWDPFAAVHGLA